MAKKKRTIEECLQELREVNAKLQDASVRMDDAIALYARGAAVAKEAHELINGYEAQIDSIEASVLPDSES